MSYCSVCPQSTRCVQAHGPRPARYMAIGEAPGRDEDIHGIPFIGQTGQEWDNTYLPLAGLSRSEIFVTNVRQCRPPQNRKPSAKEIEMCWLRPLPQELEEVKPEVVFLMGATACSLVPDIDLEIEHGIPRRGVLFGHEYWLVPMYHPALGLHETSAMIELLEDWERLEPWITNDRWQWADDDEKTDYQLSRTAKDLRDYFLKYPEIGFLGGDTESHAGKPYSIQVSISTGTGRIVLLDDRALVKELGGWINVATGSFGKQILCLHHAPADLDIFEQVSAFSFHNQYRDTMHEAYHLGNLPQGLKALGYRLCGVRMQSWEDLVTEPSKAKLLDWMMERIEQEALNPVIERKQLKTRLKVIEKPNGIESALMRIMRHTVEFATYDPWPRLRDLGYGADEMPMKGIKHCKLADVVRYGCRDADITLRVALKLIELRKSAEQRWAVQEEDQDEMYISAVS